MKADPRGDGALLRVENVHTYYGSIEALKGITVEVHEGEIVTLIGANGAGKSTTLRSINGLNHPRRGTIHFRGKDITREAPHDVVRLGISQSPEGRKLFPRMSVLENLEMGAFQRRDRSELRSDLDGLLALPAALRRGSSRRRDAVGRRAADGRDRACAHGPSEAAAARRAVDGPRADHRRARVRDHRRDQPAGTTILLVEQNAMMALEVATRGYVLETGTVALADDAKALLRNEQVRKTYLGETD